MLDLVSRCFRDHRWMIVAVTLPLALTLTMPACGSRRSNPTLPSQALVRPALAVGSCGTPAHDGLLNPQSNAVRLERADRDLNGDGQAEIVAVDRSM